MRPQHGFRPAHNNLLLANYDPKLSAISSQPSGPVAGFVYLQKVFVPYRVTVANLLLRINTAGASLTAGQCFGGMYDWDGSLIAKTADQSASWNSTGLKTMALTAESGKSLTLDGWLGKWIYAAQLVNHSGTTPVIRGITGATAALNENLTGAYAGTGLADGYAFANTATGAMTALPATINAVGGSAPAINAGGSANGNWVGLT